MNSDQTGGCACGAIRYRITAKPEFSIMCQCRQCQRITGSGHTAQFAITTNKVEIKGVIKYYEQLSDDGNTVSSGFCETCGSPVLKKTSGYPQYLMFHAATLDEPGAFKPEMVVYSKFKQPWDHIDPSLPRQ